jgi:hypothetical protein
MNDLLQATGYAAIVYLLFNYIVTFGSGRPLVEWINPGRKYLPLLAMALIAGSYSSLQMAARKYQKGHLALLHDLVGEEKAKPEVIGAVTLIIFGLAVLLTFIWCWWFIPRGPQTFNANPKDLIREYGRALRHYVRWGGGLDYAILCKVHDGQMLVVAEGSSDQDILRGLSRLPGQYVPEGEPLESNARLSVEGQKKAWQTLASDILQRWGELSKLLHGIHQGRNVGLSFDVRYGAVYAEMLEDDFVAGEGETPTGVFLFAACLNQHEVTTLNAARHFAMLSQAIRHIRRGVAKG